MVKDLNRNISSIEYNSLNLPSKNSTWGGTIGEVNAILQQTQHPSWFDVTKDFAYSQASYAADRLNAAKISPSDKQQKMNSLNTAFVGYASFSLDKGSIKVSNQLQEVVVYGSKRR